MKKKLLAGLLIGLFICMAAAGYAVFDLYRYMHTPIDPDSTAAASLTIAPGDNFDTIVDKLQSAGLVDHPLKFELVTRWKGVERKLQAGEYRLPKNIKPISLIAALKKGAVALHPVTIPEGFNIRQVAAHLEEKDLAGREVFLSAATSPELAAKLDIPSDTVEGYLFPDTYSFAASASPGKIIRTMVAQFRGNFPPKWEKRARELGFTVHEIVTLASIIEKETSAPSERPIIASVFHNRLERSMRLETDPTVIYGIEDFDGNLTRKHLRQQTPYNTYQIWGLPPGPIANPGPASLRAALYPADTDYLFFVAKPDGTHHFSKTLRAHNQAVRKYQLSPGRP
ncbi:MAG: endolytic transglycosylase MltG [Thermodesulfobacteriota bacterium]